jgi:magnesium transporter
MLQIFAKNGTVLEAKNPTRDAAALAAAIWIDVWNPTREEKKLLSEVVGITIEPPDEVEHFYISEQVRQSNGNVILKALLLGGLDKRRPILVPVTFIRTPGPLVTISTGCPDGLTWLVAECQECIPAESKDVFPAILDMVIDYATSVLEQVGSDLDRINRNLFQHHTSPKRRLMLSSSKVRRMQQLESILTDLGYCREVLVKLRRSTLSFRRLLGLMRDRVTDETIAKKLTSFEHELSAITDAEVDLSNGAAFMLDGAVGYINILQSKTINLMTILGVLLTPPVLVASIYGMNFEHMPELKWQWGYAMALTLMALSAAGMYLVFRTRNWL